MRHKAGAPAGRRPTGGLALRSLVVYSVPVAVTNTQDALSATTMPRRRYLAATWAAIAHAGSVCQVYLQRRVVASKAHRASPGDAGVRPVYETAAMPDRPRLLLVSYHFPPNPSVGGLRWQKMARIAYARGWALDVIMADPRALPSRDEGRLDDLPPGVALYAVAERPSRLDAIVDGLWARWRHIVRRPPEAAGATAPAAARAESYSNDEAGRIRDWRAVARAYFAWSTYRRERRWGADAARVGGALVRQHHHRAVISAGPPHFSHPAVAKMAERHHVPFLVDMRDPWRLVERLPAAMASPVWLTLAAWHERRVVDRAALIVMNTTPACAAMQHRYQDAADRTIAVPNGYDSDAVAWADTPAPVATDRHRFVIAYAGTIYLDRDPAPLFHAAARVIEDLALKPSDFGIEFMGDAQSYNGVTVESLARDAGLEAFVRVKAAWIARRSICLSLARCDARRAAAGFDNGRAGEALRLHAIRSGGARLGQCQERHGPTS